MSAAPNTWSSHPVRADPDVSRLVEICQLGGGLASYGQLTAAGIERRTLARAVRDGIVRRPTAGWYVVENAELSPRDRLTQDVRAVLQTMNESVVVSHSTALSLLEVAQLHRDPVLRFAQATPSLRTWRRPGLSVQRLPEGAPSQVRGGLRTVTPAVAAVQVGIEFGPRALLVSADAAVAGGMAEPDEIGQMLELFTGYRRVAQLRRAVAAIDGRRESPGESLLAWIGMQLGLTLLPQFVVRAEGWLYRADFRVEGEWLLLEFDGMQKYGEGREARQALRAQHAREADLRAAGWEIVRFQWSDLERPELVRSRIGAGLVAARARHRGR